MPGAVAEEAVPESALDNETASGVGGDDSGVVGKDGEAHPMKVELVEPAGKREAGCFAAKALLQASRVEDADTESC